MSEKLALASLEAPRHETFLMMPTQMPKEYSEETARQIDEEVKQILLEAHGRERDIRVAHRTALEELVLEKEVVDRQALQAILKVRSIDSLKEKRRAADISESESHQSKQRTGIASGWEMIGPAEPRRFDLPRRAIDEERNQTPRRKVR